MGYLVNHHGIKSVYAPLAQPLLAPPAEPFAPAWTILYRLISFTAYHATATLSPSPSSLLPSSSPKFAWLF
ncbi:hypothetical protein BJX64DRAFT_264598 [Aspergillus heterothallicus]